MVLNFNTSIAQHFCPIKITIAYGMLYYIKCNKQLNKNILDKHQTQKIPNVQVTWYSPSHAGNN